ncbi:hypothetical protein [Microcoleus sp. bin38.metabat.b11b12b14.051]|uniref:hypothetical protein n=1 Tax=Microcoleus sp. bin38.metabat.b11b12b14.051 TaxID=2742709 RepID=UPI0025D28D8E|nr:hypothetical protein [Microcoleus sp. bin38.metabat.b11b12b14.051]
MEEVLALIEKKKQEFAKSGLFEFMRDKSINPRQRLAFAPCVAAFVMSFGEFNKYVFREEPTNDPIQEIVNKHSYEDDHHWLWFLEDLETLSINKTLRFSDALNFLWNEETKASRWVTHQIFRYAFGATPIARLAILEVIEATGNVFFSTAAPIAEELRTITQKEFLYFGCFHLAVETGHTTGTPDVEQLIQNIQLTIESRQEAFEVVENLFEAFTKLTDELLVYAKTHSFDQPFAKPREILQPLKAA